jgi:hypothetical protein
MAANKLGKFVFTLESTDPVLTEQISSLFPQCDEATGSQPPPVAVPVKDSDVRTIVNYALLYHYGCIWADAACLIAPNGKKVLFAGASHSGKSTCALSLALCRQWKVLSEDITLFDPKTDELLQFPSPFSLKPGGHDRLASNNIHAPEPVLDEWVPLKEMASTPESVSAEIDFAIFFNVIDKTAPGPLVSTELKGNDFIRLLLPISNLLHAAEFIEKLGMYLANARCCQISGGTIEERMNSINALATGS